MICVLLNIIMFMLGVSTCYIAMKQSKKRDSHYVVKACNKAYERGKNDARKAGYAAYLRQRQRTLWLEKEIISLRNRTR